MKKLLICFSLFLVSCSITTENTSKPSKLNANNLRPTNQPIEIGTVNWGRDFDKALKLSKEKNKPVLVLFQEVPGCSGCQNFGRNVLSHPQIVESIEAEFVPVVVFNNRRGKDSEILKKYKEPAWNYQVIRFLDSSGKDIIPRKDRVWSVSGVAERMIEALKASNKTVPEYLKGLSYQGK